jgi:hypothetical protein
MLEEVASTTGRETPLDPGVRPLPGHSIPFRSVIYNCVQLKFTYKKRSGGQRDVDLKGAQA